MKIVKIEYCSRELIFKNIFQTSQTKSSTRKIYYLKLTLDDGKCFYGECAPLPQFGSENYPEVEYELNRLASLKNIALPASEEDIKALINDLAGLPTVNYALEQALLQVLALQNSLPRPLINNKEISVNALVDMLAKDKVIESVSKLYNSGYTTIKLKTGRKKFDEDLNIISTLHNQYGDKINFRLDVNGKWSLNEAYNNLNKLEDFNIEYIEQPVADTDKLIELSNNINIPLAADESVRNVEDVNRLLNSSSIKYIVLKPMLLGGYYKTSEIVKAAKTKGAKIVVSSSLESNLGRKHLTAIASTIDNNLAHGLGTSNLFVNDAIPDSFPVREGKINYSPELLEVHNIA